MLPWVVVWVCPIKVNNDRPQPIPVRARSGDTNDPVCAYHAIRRRRAPFPEQPPFVSPAWGHLLKFRDFLVLHFPYFPFNPWVPPYYSYRSEVSLPSRAGNSNPILR